MTLALDANAFDRAVAAVEAATGHGSRGDARQRSAHCPAHEDRNASLSITRGESRVLLKCHAGCDIDDVLAAAGLVRADLFDLPAQREERASVIATYDYTDARGELLYQVVRMHPKTFRQRRPSVGGDGWTWNLQGVDRVLYRLPAVLEQAAQGGLIYIVEGEKDVHSIEAVGAVATCNSGGAGKWQESYATAFDGADVVIVADKDEPGRAHARRVAETLLRHAATIRVAEALSGKDVTDHLTAGHTLDELVITAAEPADGAALETPRARAVRLTRASDIKIRPVHWLWQHRVALGTLALLGGREGIGKSTLAYQLAADITRGKLRGAHEGTPKAVIVAATEDSWEHTIVPRLMAARADLTLVYRVDVTTPEGFETELSLPVDLDQLEKAVRDVDAALILLDPLMSRLSAKLDTHKDAEVRLALEPLVKIGNTTGAAILGIIHVNKSNGVDPLNLIMGSKAFAAVARAVLFAIKDPDDESIRMVGQPKNNLGRTDLPTLTFRIDSHHVADTDEGPIFTSRLNWQGESERTIGEVLQSIGEAPEERTATADAVAWLKDYLTRGGGTADSAKVKEDGRRAGHTDRTLKRAVRLAHCVVEDSGFPRRTYWRLPSWANEQHLGPTGQTTQTDVGPTGQNGTKSQSGQTREPWPDWTDDNETDSVECPESVLPPVGPSDLGPTGEHPLENAEHPSIRARARGLLQVGPTGEETASRAKPETPRAHARDPAPPCPRCEWPLDHPDHFTICGGDE